jgi:serine/threonine protein kinase
MHSNKPKFLKFEDELSVLVSSPARPCKHSCGHPLPVYVNRRLVLAEVCCNLCSETKGVQHDSACNERSNTQRPERGANLKPPSIRCVNEPVSDADMRRDVIRLMASLPEMDSGMNSITAINVVAVLCKSHGLPVIDEKRIIIIFSRFSVGDTIPANKTKLFFYTILKKLYKLIEMEPPAISIPRHFFIIKNTRVVKQYRFKSVIGQGSFGVVYRVEHKLSGQARVCKSVSKSSCTVPLKQLEAEIRIIGQLDHPNIIRLYEFFEDDVHVHLIMEHCRGGDLMGHIKRSIKMNEPLGEDFINNIIRQVLCALAFMHNKRIIHKDIKPENIMLYDSKANERKPTVKIIDLGLSEMFSLDQEFSSTVAGTAYFMSPEIFRPPFNQKCDVWACGVITFFMLTGFLPFFGSSVGEVKSNVLYRRLQWPVVFGGSDVKLDLSNEVKEFTEKLLDKDFKNRPEALEALDDPWITGASTSRNVLFGLPIALNFLCFSNLSWLQRVFYNIAAHIWEFKEANVIRDIYLNIDSNQRGYVTIRELAETLEKVSLTAFDSWKIAKSLDLSGSGCLTYTSLVAAMAVKNIAYENRIFRAVFEMFKPDTNGCISSHSMRHMLVGHMSAYSSEVDDATKQERFSRIFMSEFRNTPPPNSCHSGDFFIDFPLFKEWMLRNNN